eukprot:TRINITY_DN11243_c0_g1_i1.p1 TRINITY_DN11243_c0_g1~~TRINITY_DN11243_c0_g1_i1.p1  ORF type:complete len:572 (+),score=56.44 TRINITY_DN11243_c0_g1_i1:272-1987(+)
MEKTWRRLAAEVEGLASAGLQNQARYIQKVHDEAAPLKVSNKTIVPAIRVLWGCASARVKCRELFHNMERELTKTTFNAQIELGVLWSMARCLIRCKDVEVKLLSHFRNKSWLEVNGTYMTPGRVATAGYSLATLRVRDQGLCDRLCEFYLKGIDGIDQTPTGVHNMGKGLFELSHVGRLSPELVHHVMWNLKYNAAVQSSLEDEETYLSGGALIPACVVDKKYFHSTKGDPLSKTVRNNLQQLTICYLEHCGLNIKWLPLSIALFNYASTGGVHPLLLDALSEKISKFTRSTQSHQGPQGKEALLLAFAFDSSEFPVPASCVAVIRRCTASELYMHWSIPNSVVIRLADEFGGLMSLGDSQLLRLFYDLFQRVAFSLSDIIRLCITAAVVNVRYQCSSKGVKDLSDDGKISDLLKGISNLQEVRVLPNKEVQVAVATFVASSRLKRELLIYQKSVGDMGGSMGVVTNFRETSIDTLTALLQSQQPLSFLNCVRAIYAVSLFPLCVTTRPLLGILCDQTQTLSSNWDAYHCSSLLTILLGIRSKSDPADLSPPLITALDNTIAELRRFLKS